ncbi:hypothetical protein B0H67DRAFT_395614 [Lasiosphaeris hirsuta]|uniref:Zn(2)-C6 fungal-type domain-containing protein n=1 Tax=Lasiosphaeris hirsuta TaxID=260670 RepID=A0AA40DJN7_9PEZI|nr:hypothetical protein B0H67DRAFT_395614 [Lasiosphaeris hirsuta]
MADLVSPIPREKMRRRPALACESCRQRKVRCDRNLPCSTCIKSRSDACTYVPLRTGISPALSGARQPRALQPNSTRSNADSVPRRDHSLTPSSAYSTRPAAISSATNLPVDILVDRVKDLELQLSQARDQLAANSPASSANGQESSTVRTPGSLDDLASQDTQINGGAGGDTSSIHKARFFGPSHWMNDAGLLPTLLKLMYTAELKKESPLTTGLEKCKALARAIKARRVPAFLTVPSSVPHRALANELVQNYLGTFETVYRVLHVPSFKAEYERYWENPAAANKGFVVLMQLSMAVGTCFHDDVTELRPMAMRWVYEAHVWLGSPGEKSRLTMHGLQTLCLLHFAQQSVAIGGDLTWVGAGSLLRRAMYCGLHADPRHMAGMSLLRAEMRRRLWATIMEINLQSCIDAGGPPLIALQDFDTAPPANLDDEDLIDDGTSTPPTRAANRSTQVSTQIAIYQSFPVRLAIAKAVNNIHHYQSYDEIFRLSSALTAACHGLQQHFSLLAKDYGAAGGVTGFQRRMSTMMLHRFFLALHLPSIGRSLQSPAYCFSRKVCIDTALRLASIANLPPQTPATLSPSDGDFVRLVDSAVGPYGTVFFQATIILGFELLARKEEQREQGVTMVLGESELHAILDASLEWSKRKIRKGRTNIKGHMCIGSLVAQINAIDAGLEGLQVEDAIRSRASELVRQSYDLLKELASKTTGRDADETRRFGLDFEYDAFEVDPMDLMQGWEDMSS